MIPRKLILRAFKQVKTELQIETEKTAPMKDFARFAQRDTESKDSLLKQIANQISKENELPFLTHIDIIGVMLGVVRFVFQPRHSSTTSRFEIYTDRYLSNTNSFVLQTGITETFDQILTGDDLSPELTRLIEDLLKCVNDKYANLEWGFDLHIPTEQNISLGNEKVDDRIFVEFKEKEIIIVGKYKGGGIAVERQMTTDLSLIFALLEFEKTIVDQRDESRVRAQEVDGALPKIDLEFSFARDHSIAFAFLKKHYDDHIRTFEVGNFNSLHLGLFHLLEEEFPRPILKTAVHFFHSEKSRLATFRFLHYWCAIETMLGSPQEEIGKRLCHAFLLIMPEKTEEEFWHLYGVRNAVAHKGQLFVDRDDLWKIERAAKNIFYRLFSTVANLKEI